VITRMDSQKKSRIRAHSGETLLGKLMGTRSCPQTQTKEANPS
jgi:hypothetical protein